MLWYVPIIPAVSLNPKSCSHNIDINKNLNITGILSSCCLECAQGEQCWEQGRFFLFYFAEFLRSPSHTNALPHKRERHHKSSSFIHSHHFSIVTFVFTKWQTFHLTVWQWNLLYCISPRGLRWKKGESSFLSITILKAAAYLEYNQLQIT